jgi:uncharacterized protein involved in outer membrane biogenesis
MKKWIIRALIAFAILVVVAILGIRFFLDAAVKKGVETVGPMLTKVDVKLGSANISMLSGSGKLSGLVVGNPEGYKTPSAISVGSASLSLEPSSLFSDKIVIHSINVQAPEITFESDLKRSNLKKILANIEETTGGSGKDKTPASTQAEKKANKKLQVDEFVISGAKVQVSIAGLVGQTATVQIPEIRLSGLGTGPEGITVAELSKRVLKAVLDSSVQAAGPALADLGKNVSDLTKNLTKELGKGGTGEVEKITKGIGDLLKKSK